MFAYICNIWTIFLLLHCFCQVDISICLGAMWISYNIGLQRGGSMLSGSIAEIKNFRGFVPQDDIVHEHLTVRGLAFRIFFLCSRVWKAGNFFGCFWGGCRVHLEAVDINVYMPCAIACRYVLIIHQHWISIDKGNASPFSPNSFNPLNKKTSKCSIPNKPCFKTLPGFAPKK